MGCFFSSSETAADSATRDGCGLTSASGRSERSSSADSQSAAAPVMTLRSSRTLPGRGVVGEGCGCGPGDGLGGVLTVKEEVSERENVIGALPQGRNVDLQLSQAVEEIGAERVGGVLLAEVAIGGGDDSHVYSNAAGSAEAEVRRRVEHTEQFDLDARVEFADFVQEKCPAVREFE